MKFMTLFRRKLGLERCQSSLLEMLQNRGLIDRRASLPEGFIECDTDAGRQVQASDVLVRHGYRKASGGTLVEQVFWQTAGFRPEDQAILVAEAPRRVCDPGFRCEVEKPRIR